MDRWLHRFLQGGGVIAYATESCFGLGCDPRNAKGVRRLRQLKGRPQSKGLILVAADIRQLKPYLAPLPESMQEQLTLYWPGPYTLLLPASQRCPHWLIGKHHTIAVRISAHPDAVRACRMAGMALVSTSANRSGQRPLHSGTACRAVFGDAIQILPGRTGTRKRPSTLLDPFNGRVVRP